MDVVVPGTVVLALVIGTSVVRVSGTDNVVDEVLLTVPVLTVW